MFVPWLRWTNISRVQLIVRLVFLVSVIGLVLYFWSDFCLWRADANLSKRNHESAANWVDRRFWINTETDPRTCLLQLRIARRRGDFREVERQLTEAAQLGVPKAKIERERLLATVQTNQFGQMERRWGELLNAPGDDGPEIARAYYTWNILDHNLKQAEKTLKLWHADYPRDAEPLALTGRFYQSIENWEGAEDAFRQAFALAPENSEYQLSLAKVLQIRLKTKDAIPLYQNYLRKHRDNLVAIQGLAECAAVNGDLKTSIQLLQGAMKQNPDDFATQKAYGETLLAAGDAPAAVSVLEKAYRTMPEHANLAYSLARGLKACGRTSEADPLFAFVAESRPQLDQMIKLEKQLQTHPKNLELRMQIASITAKYVSRRDAIRWYENLLQVSPNYVSAHEVLADLYRQLGDEKLAQAHTDYVLRNSPAANSTDRSSEPTEQKPSETH